jgi:hypothetical protein
VGERLVLKMAGSSASSKSHHTLWKELVATGQPFTPPPPPSEDDYKEDEHDLDLDSSWKKNYLYMAPSNQQQQQQGKGKGKGWGIFAAQPFRKGEVVELAPLWVGFEQLEPLVRQTLLDNYHAQRWEWDGTTHHSKTVVIFGSSSIFNHGNDETEQNIKLVQIMGNDDDDDDNDHRVATFGHYALRDIAVGEELLTNYGTDWFTQRGLNQVVTEKDDPRIDEAANNNNNNRNNTTLWIDNDEWREMYTSKIYAGHGREEKNLQGLFNVRSRDYNMRAYIRKRMAPFEAGYRNARAKVSITEAGTLLEILPALVLAKEMVLDTDLEPIVLFWDDLESSSFGTTLDPDFKLPETVNVMYQNRDTDWSSEYEELNRVEETVLVPLGGSLSVLQRTTSDDPQDYNCRLEGITPDRWNKNAFTIRIVSTKPIEVGERLVLKLAGNSASPHSRHALLTQLVATGQPFTPPPPEDYQDDDSWQETYVYMAPSTQGKGWGVFAAKSFRKGDIVELAPLWVGFERMDPLMRQTLLDNYHAERWEWDGTMHHSKTVLIFGPNHFFNHGNDDEQNVKLLQMGDDETVAYGHYALRDIAMGEELLANYGTEWFAQRGLHQVAAEGNDPLDQSSPTKSTPWIDDDEWKELYTSKIYAGHGRENCPGLSSSQNRDYNMKAYIRNRMAPWESGYRSARAKVPITEAGTLLEILPALIMAKHMVLDTLLEPIVLFWNDLEPSSFVNPEALPKTVPVLTHVPSVSGWSRENIELNRVEETVLLPLAGYLSVLERTKSDDPEDYNCRLEGITPDRWNENAFTIRIVATKPIEVGERLILNLAGISSSPTSLIALWNHLVETRQPLVAALDEKDEDYYEDEAGVDWTDAEADGEEEMEEL